MVDNARAARRFWQTPLSFSSWSAATQACLIVALLVMASGVICVCRQAQGAESNPTAQTVVPGSPLSFEDSVRIAINRSPRLMQSSLDIDIRRMDETDSRYGMVPPLTFRTYYYVNRPSGAGLSGAPYSLSFSTDPYNPMGAYFSLQAQKLATQVAVLTHLKVISQGLYALGNYYLQLDALNKLAGYQKDLIKVARENLTYGENRMNIGTGTSLEVKVAQQELQLAQGEEEGIALSIKRISVLLRNFLGLPANQDITVNFRDSQRQVLGNFAPATASLEQAKSRSYELKALEIHKKLQGYNVSLAIAKVFPTILFNTQTPDPLSVTTAHGLYVGVGLEIPVWDGLKRVRNVSRQKAVLKQIGAQKDVKANFLEEKWYEYLVDIQEKQVALKNSQAREELARLKTHQKEVRYHSGEVTLPVFLESRKEVLEAQKEAVRNGLQYDMAVLKLRELSGDLGNTYVDENSWQK
ncbi:MAG: TolC family protein [Desulfobaccales bacterium]